MSEAERADRITPGHRASVEDIRALAGPSTPHFALQVRNRIARLIESLPEGDPVRAEGERQIARLSELAAHSGDPRGFGPADEAELHDRGGLPEEAQGS